MVTKKSITYFQTHKSDTMLRYDARLSPQTGRQAGDCGYTSPHSKIILKVMTAKKMLRRVNTNYSTLKYGGL